MKGQVVSIGPDNDEMNQFVASVSNYGFKVEPYTSIEVCLSEIVQGFDPDVILIQHQPENSDAIAFAQLLTEEHKLLIPFVLLVNDELENQIGKLSQLPGIFAVHDMRSEPQLVCNSVLQAVTQKQFLKISQRLLAEGAQLLKTLGPISQVAEALQNIDSSEVSSASPVIDQIKTFRDQLRGRDLSKELDKSCKFFDSHQDKLEKISKFGFKS